MVFCDKGKSLQYRNITTEVKELYNIMNTIKEDLEYFEKYDYTIKVDVVKILIKKIDDLVVEESVNEKTYRWKGVFLRANNNGTYEPTFDKAWKAEKNLFRYKAYDMDPNDETPLECVPNALYKMYGDKSKGKTYFNAKIANGGMEYVKKMLDIGGESSALDVIDDNEPQYIEGKKGYTPMVMTIRFDVSVMIG